MTIKNLWGEIANLPKVKAPVAILNEQAQLLEELTGGLLIGRVVQLNLHLADRFSYGFYINAASLNNYSYFVLFIEHNINLYPLVLSTDKNQIADSKTISGVRCNDINEFEAELEKIFSSPEIQRVISGLLSQIQTA